MKKKVSVIVPAYNVEKYIYKCINSIINQTYSYTQIIIVDDGSTDDTFRICNEFKSKDKRIEVYHKKNGGLGSSRNLGIDKATGDYLMFVDGDDFIESSMIEKLLKNAERSKADIVMCNNYMFDQNTHFLSYHLKQDKIVSVGKWSRDKFWHQLYSGNWGLCIVVWNKLYDAKLFNNIKFEVDKLNEDDFIITKLLHVVNYIYVIPDRLYYYRINRQNSIMTNDQSDDPKYLDGVESQIIRFIDAEENSEIALMEYCFRAIPGLMMKQYGCRHAQRFIDYKKYYLHMYRRIMKKSKNKYRLTALFIIFYYFTPICNLGYIVRRKMAGEK